MPSAAATRLFQIGRRLQSRRARGLPPLLAFTDPARTPDLAALAFALPRGAAIVFRAFGADDAEAQGRALARICRRRGVMFLVGADVGLARQLRADGVHLPERAAHMLRRPLPRAWLVTVAAHTQAALARAAVADAAVLSPVFASRSPSAGAPLGVRRAWRWARRAKTPVYALGGVNPATARTLPRGAWAGVAAIDGLKV